MKRTIYITVREAAEQVAVSRMTIYRLIEDGTIPSFRVGRSIRIRRSDWDAYLKAQEQQ